MIATTDNAKIIISGSGALEIIDFLKTKYNLIVMDDSCNKLAKLRAIAKLTQKQLSDATGIRQSVISEYENGKRKITFSAAQKLASALNIAPEELE